MDENGPRGYHVKMNFEYFQILKLMLQKKEIKKWSDLVLMSPSLVMVIKIPKKVHFLQFCADLSKKLIKAIC